MQDDWSTDEPSLDHELGAPILAVRSAREAAYTAIEENRNSGNWLSDTLDRIFRSASLPAIERGLATELACGVVRRQATLDAILRKLVARPLNNVEAPLLTVLRLGIYQLALLDAIPPHAAVHETVDLTKRLGRMRWSGFVNGVLRGGTRLITREEQTEPSSKGVPLAAGRYRLLTESAFRDPAADPVSYFVEAFSFPRWLAERWAARNKPADLFRLGAWFNSSGKLFLRVNELRTTRESFADELQQVDVSAQSIDNGAAWQLNDSISVEKLPGYEAGWFAVQDLSAMQAAARLAPAPGQCIWDVCAAPGGKACHLAQLMKNQGQILATDIRPERLRLIEENRHRLGADIIQTQLIGEDGAGLPPGPFDAILIDVPCSNTGVLGKRPEARWRITPTSVKELNRVQEQLLVAGIERLAVNGRLVYSTCSIEPEENGDLVRRVLSNHPALRLIDEQLFLPGQPADGGYQALITSA